MLKQRLSFALNEIVIRFHQLKYQYAPMNDCAQLFLLNAFATADVANIVLNWLNYFCKVEVFFKFSSSFFSFFWRGEVFSKTSTLFLGSKI